jgi:hypothetical protein
MTASALAYGPLTGKGPLPGPRFPVVVVRALDMSNAPKEKYGFRMTGFSEVLLKYAGKFLFVCICLGPDVPMTDAFYSHLSATIDELAHEYGTVYVISAGNNGRSDPEDPDGRVQIPSDATYCVCVGAAGQKVADWVRALYSGTGPGRPNSPKPFVVFFGGTAECQFLVLGDDGTLREIGEEGTSFAAPALLREMILAFLATRNLLPGPDGRPSAEPDPFWITLFVAHYADKGRNRAIEVGFGYGPEADIMIYGLPDEKERIFVQNRLEPGTFQLVKVPMPAGGWQSSPKWKIRATFGYVSNKETLFDPVASELAEKEVVFMKDGRLLFAAENQLLAPEELAEAIAKGAVPFFDTDGGSDEGEGRVTTIHSWIKRGELVLDASSLADPFFIVRMRDPGTTLNKEVKYGILFTLSPAA